MDTLVIIPAYQAQAHLGGVLSDLRRLRADLGILVVDDGSTDETASVATAARVWILRHGRNRGKGAALKSGLEWAKTKGFAQAVTADADGQHPAQEVLRLVDAEAPAHALVLGIRDLRRDGAPRANQCSNGISNRFLSLFTGQKLRDTQCGLRRYPVTKTLALGCQDTGYAFEAEVLLHAARSGLPILQLPIRVHYPPAEQRLSHFRAARDPYRIVFRVVSTLLE